MKDWEVRLEDLGIIDEIGQGGFATVWKAKHSDLNMVAFKQLKATTLSSKALENFNSECRQLKKLRHPNIVMFMGMVETDDQLGIVMEYLKYGSLDKFVAHYGPSILIKQNFLLGIVTGLCVLHTRNPPIVHMDIKLQNVLVSNDLDSKITDFGLSECRPQYRDALNSTKGTITHLAPEYLNNPQQLPELSWDMYALAILIYQLVAVEKPYKGLKQHQITSMVLDGQRPDLSKIPSEILHSSLGDWMQLCWDQNPNKRLTCKALQREMESQWKHLFHGEKLEQEKNKLRSQISAQRSLEACRQRSTDPVNTEFSMMSNNPQVALGEHNFHANTNIARTEPTNNHVHRATSIGRPDDSPMHTSGSMSDSQTSDLLREGGGDSQARAGAGSSTEKPPFMLEDVRAPPMTPSEKAREAQRWVQGIPHNPNAALNASYPTNPPSYSRICPGGGETGALGHQGKDGVHHIATTHTGHKQYQSPACLDESLPGYDDPPPPIPKRNRGTDQEGVLPPGFTKQMTAMAHGITGINGGLGSAAHITINTVVAGDKNIVNVDNTGKARSQPRMPERHGPKVPKIPINKEHILLCSEHVGMKWRHLGRELGFTDGQLDAIQSDYQQSGLQEQIYQLMLKWQQREAQRALLPSLVRALSNAKCGDAINKIKRTVVGRPDQHQ